LPRTQADINARAFLAAYKLTGDITAAAAAAKIDKGNHYRWLKQSEKYRADFAQARIEAGDLIEAGAIRRTREGTLEPVFYQGLKVGAIRRWPEGLTMFLLRGLKPEVYGQKTQITGADGGPLEASMQVRFIDAQPTED
jgi:hypothetical protein